MKIIGCDFHPSFQQIAMLDTVTGELVERKLLHPEQATRFYESLAGEEVLVGLESMGNTLWFERVLNRLGFTLWIGDALAIRVSNPRKQKTDKRDAGHILRLLQEGRFPRIWVPSLAERDLRQLLKHRHTLVQMRTRSKNQLQHIALNQGWQKKAQAMDSVRAGVAAPVGTGTLDEPAAGRPVADAGGNGATDHAVERDGGASCGPATGGGVADEPSGRRSDPGAGHSADAGRCKSFSPGQACRQLSGTDSQRSIQRAAATAGSDQQTRQ